jgi:hypothetical protein
LKDGIDGQKFPFSWKNCKKMKIAGTIAHSGGWQERRLCRARLLGQTAGAFALADVTKGYLQ